MQSIFQDFNLVFTAGSGAAFALGLASALALGIAGRVFGGMRLNLYLVNRDSPLRDQSLIPITEELKRSSVVRSFLQKRWRENVDLTLMDYHDHSYTFRIGYDLWRRFYLELLHEPDGPEASPKLNGKVLMKGSRYALRTGMRLTTGDRAFSVLVTPRNAPPTIHKEFMSAA